MQIVSNVLFSLMFHVGMNIADIEEKTYTQLYLHLYSMNCRTLRTEWRSNFQISLASIYGTTYYGWFSLRLEVRINPCVPNEPPIYGRIRVVSILIDVHQVVRSKKTGWSSVQTRATRPPDQSNVRRHK